MKPDFVDKISVEVYENAVILPSITEGRLGGVVTRGGEYVESSAYVHGGLTLWGGYYSITDEMVEDSQEEVIFIGHLQKHWGNFLFDNMGRLWYGLTLDDEKIKYAYCGFDIHDDELKDSSRNYMDVFRALGINRDRIIEISKPTRFSKVVIPELSLFPGTFYTKEMIDTYSAMIRYANMVEYTDIEREYRSMPKKIYLSRTKLPVRKENGEEEIERIFTKLGYSIVSPEQMSQTKLIFLINHCDKLAALEGTITHNVMFTRQGTSVAILRKMNYENTRQTLFNEASGVVTTYIDIYIEPFKYFPRNHDEGPFWIGATAALRRYAKKELKESGGSLSTSDLIYFAWRRSVNCVIYMMKCMYYRLVLKK